MATSFPGSLDSFVNPSGSDALDSVSVPHATQHADLNDAVEALQAKVGVDGSAVTSSLDYQLANIGTWTTYTPTFTTTGTAPSLGNGSLTGIYTEVNKIVMGQIMFQAGNTTTYGSGVLLFSIPVTAAPFANFSVCGHGYIEDATTTNVYTVVADHSTYNDKLKMRATQGGFGDVSTVAPFTFAANDSCRLYFAYQAA